MSYRSNMTQARRAMPYRTYENARLNRQSSHSAPVSVGQAKAQRLRIKNMRRADNGLPPKATYAEI